MSLRALWRRPRTRLDVTAGLVDGILNALTLASGRVLKAGVDINLAWRVGAAAAATTLFVFFVAHYAELRAELVRSEKELNLTSHGRLATTALGRRAMLHSCVGASIAAVCGLVGATFPLLICYLLPRPPWLCIAISIALLGLLGLGLARSVHGAGAYWALALVAGGIALTWLGSQLDIAG